MFVPIIIGAFAVVLLGVGTAIAYLMGLATQSAIEAVEDYQHTRQNASRRKAEAEQNPATSLLRPNNPDAEADAVLVRPVSSASPDPQELLRTQE